ncbi:hypothetical protein IFM89_031680 [Coptis chinensis]|uniref:Pentatricopeptide repeat-containing protein n=1 Tax=Coptis chinensis TaxID=261450 RepID=A0A835HNM8_9MAGN|nr:hypothetical protein IFM89_031680 [Coptis chinensis]
MGEKDVVTWNIMITHLSKQDDDMELARKLFDEMLERSVRSWTAMIAGYVQCGNSKEPIRMFTDMEAAGGTPNEVTVVAVLAACADLGTLDLGIAQDSFYKMKERTIVSWSAMIGGYAMHGQAEEALKLFSKMSCIVNEGCGFFSSMARDYEIIPQIEHYGCMVDLLSRSGLLQEAHEFIKNMSIKANGVMWGALGGCKVHKNVELAVEAIKHLLVLDPLNDGYYVVLSNVYADAWRWEDTARVRMLMRDQGVKKMPATNS